MAEYYISYKDLEGILDEYINDTSDNKLLIEYKAEILSALTGDYEMENRDSATEMIALWKNQISSPSQILLGARYIRVHQMMLDFLKGACTSGVIDAVIQYVSTGSMVGFTVSVGAGITIALWDLFNSIKKLDDWDFCIYMQAMTHFREFDGFTKEDLISWFPHGEPRICNMHNRTWECDFYDEVNDTCNMLKSEHLDKALESLYEKGLLMKNKENHKYVFKFKK